MYRIVAEDIMYHIKLLYSQSLSIFHYFWLVFYRIP